MDPLTVSFLKGVIAFILVAGTVLSALKLWLSSRAKVPLDFDRIIDGVREENASLHAIWSLEWRSSRNGSISPSLA